MRVLNLVAENIKKIKVVDITPDPYMTQITGANGSGKTSVLDSLFWALAGKDAIQDKPIRTGCDRARIKLNLGSILVERKFTPNGTTVSITNEEGLVFKSPQAMLDGLFGELSFDPLKFARAKPREQYDELRKISNIPVDIDALNAANAADFAKRTEVNREAKGKRAQSIGIFVPAGTPEQPVSETDLLDRIEQAGKFNADIERRRENRKRAAQDIEDLKGEYRNILGQITPAIEVADRRIEDLKRQLAEAERDKEEISLRLNKQADEKLSAANDLQGKLDAAGPLPDLLSVSELRSKLDTARETNRAVELAKQQRVILGEADVLETEARTLTDRMSGRESEITNAVQSAKMPVAGLGFGDGYVTFQGVPLDQASSAEQLRVSCAIAMAGNPKLRIIRIQDGSLLDDDGLRMIYEAAKEHDYQVFLEKVDTSGKIGIYMEDGSVAAVNAETTA